MGGAHWPPTSEQGTPLTEIVQAGRPASCPLADLLLDLWRLDLRTWNSCQDNFGRVWIEFWDAYRAEMFLSIVAGAYDRDLESLYNRAVGSWTPDDREEFREHRAWQYDLHADDLNVRLSRRRHCERRARGPPEIILSVSVRFPRSDLPEVEQRIRAHLEATHG